MMQFVSGNILESHSPVVALPVQIKQDGKEVAPLDQKAAKAFPDSWVRLKRFLRSHQLNPGELWVDDGAGQPRLVLLASHGPLGSVQVPMLRKSLRRLANWADRNDVAAVAVGNLGSADRTLAGLPSQQIAYEQLVDSRCRFVVYENQEMPPQLEETTGSPLARWRDQDQLVAV